MPIKDKFADASKMLAGEIDVLPITDIQAEFPNVASNSAAKQDLSMSEYGYAIGISPGQKVKFSDMFGVSNYTKIKFKPGQRKQSYNVAYGMRYTQYGTQQSKQIGIGNPAPGRNFLYSTNGRYTNQYTGGGDLTLNHDVSEDTHLNARIPGYNRCDILAFETKHNSNKNPYNDTSGSPPLYNSHTPDVRLFVKSYDEFPIFGRDANISGFPEYDPHWNWIKLTGKFYTRSSSSQLFSSTLDTTTKTFYFWRKDSELKHNRTGSATTSPKKYTPVDASNYGSQLEWGQYGVNSFNNTGYYTEQTGLWPAPQTIHDVAAPIRDAIRNSYGYDTAWGIGGEQSINGQYFFEPGALHSEYGGSGIHVYTWQMPYDGPGPISQINVPQYRPLWGNAKNSPAPEASVFGYHKMSTVAEEPNNEYTLEFLVKHPDSYYDNFVTDYGENDINVEGAVFNNFD